MKTIRTKLFIAASIMAVLFTINSCKKDKNEEIVVKPNYSNLIVGTWVSDDVEGTENLTDKKFVCQFNADKTEMFAEGCVVGDSTIWLEKQGFTYSLNETIMSIDASAVFGNPSTIEIELTPLNENTMKFTDKKVVINGVESEKFTYTMKKVQDNQNDKILGLWKGHETTQGKTPNEFYWEYFNNGKYTYYYYNEEAGHYLNDTTGYYYLYGDNLLAFNFYKITEDTYKYDCWETTFSGDTLRFYSKRENGIEKKYEMVKTEIHPE